MTIPFHINILLRFLINLLGIYYIKRSADEISSNDEDDSGNNLEESEEIQDHIEDMLTDKKNIKDLISKGIGDKIDNKDIPSIKPQYFKAYLSIKEKYPAFFDDEEEEISKTEALEQVKEYLSEELSSFNSPQKSFKSKGEANYESSYRVKPLDNNSSKREATSEPKESPVDFVVKKQETDLPSFLDNDE
jgi:hypothetical protein